MADTRSVQMSDDERDEFLGTGGTGVLAAAQGEDEAPYSLPVSYGFDAVDGDFYLRLAYSPDSDKEEKITDGQHVSLVVYDNDDDQWKSVVVTGTLREVTEAAIDSAVVQAMRRIHIPLVDVFDRHPRELTFRFFAIGTDRITGRKEARGAD